MTERILGLVAKLSAGIAALSFAGILGAIAFESDLRGWIEALVMTFVFSFSTSAFTAIGYLALAQRRTDVESEFWSRVWSGRFGRGLFAVARKILGKRTLGTAITHRATELSLGLAAEELYESLPKRTREELKELPPMLRRLQEDAQSLRARYEKIQEALADLGDAATSAEFGDLRTARDTVQKKLAETVGALETIRLDLLRLHAGNATIAGVTTHLDLAAEVSREVERLIAAQGEVDLLLRAPTPTH